VTVSPPVEPPHAGPAGSVSTQRLGGCVIVRLAGDFGADAEPIRTTLCDLVVSDHVVVELSRAALPAATAVRALTAAHEVAGRHRTSLHVTGAHGALRRLLRRSHLEHGPAYHENLADAVEAALTAHEARTDGADQVGVERAVVAEEASPSSRRARA
jgi:hypothetical protein